jgi:hypothetical protein
VNIEGVRRTIYIKSVEHMYKLLSELQKGLAKGGVIDFRAGINGQGHATSAVLHSRKGREECT